MFIVREPKLSNKVISEHDRIIAAAKTHFFKQEPLEPLSMRDRSYLYFLNLLLDEKRISVGVLDLNLTDLSDVETDAPYIANVVIPNAAICWFGTFLEKLRVPKIVKSGLEASHDEVKSRNGYVLAQHLFSTQSRAMQRKREQEDIEASLRLPKSNWVPQYPRLRKALKDGTLGGQLATGPVREWFLQQSADTWHVAVECFVNAPDYLEEIALSPRLDKATAAYIYAVYSECDWQHFFTGQELVWEGQKTIAKRWLKEGFEVAELAFDMGPDLARYEAAYEAAREGGYLREDVIPPEDLYPWNGRSPDTDFFIQDASFYFQTKENERAYMKRNPSARLL